MDSAGGAKTIAKQTTSERGTPMDKNLEKRYRNIVRSHKNSGAMWQPVPAKQRRVKPSKTAEGSQYWSHQENHGKRDENGELIEAAHANPENGFASSKADVTTAMRNEQIELEVTDRVRRLMDLAKQILTDQQYNVFVLTMVRDPALTQREAGKVLGLSHQVIARHMDAVRVKLQRAYEERT